MTLGEFFLKLAIDTSMQSRFAEDPRGAVDAAQLSEAQRALVLSGTLQSVRVKVKAEFEIDGEIVAYVTVHTVTVHLAGE
jgi:hypothetical protein